MDGIFRYIDRSNGYDIKPYLTDESTNYVIREDNDNILSNDEISPDYTMEKYFLYDNIMTSLHVMSILYTACKLRKDIFKVCCKLNMCCP